MNDDYKLAPDELRDAFINDADVDAHEPDDVTIRSYPPGSGEYNDMMFGEPQD
jgi:hypothetical protein